MLQDRPKKRNKEESKLRFLNAALDLFSKYGYDGTTTKKIAEKAKLNESLITRYFNGKEGLFLSVVERFYYQVAMELPPVTQEMTIADELKNYAKKIMTHTVAVRMILKVIIARSLSDIEFSRKMHYLLGTNKIILERLKQINANSDSQVPDDEIETAMFAIETMLGLTVTLYDVVGLDRKDVNVKLEKFLSMYCDRALSVRSFTPVAECIPS